MTFFRFHVLAREEFRRATLYYAERGRALGEEFVSRVEQALASVQRFPSARRAVDASGARQALVRQFPYALVYIVENDAAGQTLITIYAVAHTKRKPGYWRERLPSGSEDDV